MPDSNPDEHRAIYDQMIDTLALLHSYDPSELGLAKHGKPGNYCERQISRWTKQYRLSELQALPAMDKRFHELLKIDGRLFMVVGEAPAMEALLITRVGENEWGIESLFETELAPLVNCKVPSHFCL